MSIIDFFHFFFPLSFQNVFSKKLLSSDHPYSPPELQFYTSAAAIVVQLPFWFFMVRLNMASVKIFNYGQVNNFVSTMHWWLSWLGIGLLRGRS